MKLRTFIFLTALALGLLPLFTLVIFNLSGHMAKHEQDSARANLARARIHAVRLQAEVDRFYQTLRHFGALPQTEEIFQAGVGEQQRQELRALLSRWLAPEESVAGLVLLTAAREPVFSWSRSGAAAELGLAAGAPKLPTGNQGRPEVRTVLSEDGTELLLLLPVGGEQGKRLGLAAFRLDLARLLSDLPESYWVRPDGRYLQAPDLRENQRKRSESTAPGPDLKADFPEVAARLTAGEPFLWQGEARDLAWLPLLGAVSPEPLLWVGLDVNRVAEGWKSSLLMSIFWILLLMIVLVFLVATRMAADVEKIKEDMLTGLERILHEGKEVRFHWKGPRELQTLAQELNALAHRYKVTRDARRQAEAGLRESEEKFRNLTASAHDAIILMDSDGDITYWNEAATNIFGYTDHAALGQPVHALIHPRRIESGSSSQRFRNPAAGAPLQETLELVTRRRDGSEVPIELSLSAAHIQEQWHAIWIVRDISERKRAEEEARRQQQQLVQADKMISLGLLVSGVAHEINNPNSIAMLNAPMLYRAWESVRPILDDYYDQHGDFLVAGLEYTEMREQIPRLFTELEESARRIRQIVQDLKDYARQDTTKHMDPVDLNEIAKAAIRLTYNKIRKSTRYFVTHYEPGLPLVKGNWHRLEQVIINLIHNGCEALPDTEAGLTLATLYDPAAETVLLQVQDEGVGISPEVIDQITDPFFTTKRNVGGTGLGLSVSAGIIKEHNGSMEFVSEPGVGTTVSLAFPALVQRGQLDGKK